MLGAAAALLGLLGGSPAAAQQIEIRFLDVGQGDAALIVTPERKVVLVDAGSNGLVVLAALRALGIDTLDLVVASHNHDDHVGGMRDVLAGIPVRNYLDNGVPSTVSVGIHPFLEDRGIRYLEASSRTMLAGSVRLRILAPPDWRLGLSAGEQNNRSVGVVVEFGSFRALFTGDSEEAELDWWLARDSVPAVHVLKAAHHGAANGFTPAWVARTRPRVVVMSLAAGNGYGHPAPATEAAWCAAGARVLRTDQNGTIIVRADSTGAGAVSVEGRPGDVPLPVPAYACGGQR